MPELIIIAFSAFLLFIITLWKRRSPANLREIPAFTRLYRTLGLSMEDGTRLHISLGRGSLLDAHGGSALAGLAMLRHIAERTSVSDQPSVASAGIPRLVCSTEITSLLSSAEWKSCVPTTGRVTGEVLGCRRCNEHCERTKTYLRSLRPFWSEVALLAEASDRESVIMVGTSDDLTGQAVLFANTQDALIGEELFAAGAYLGAGVSHVASLTVQDILRWLVILTLLGGAAAKFFGAI